MNLGNGLEFKVPQHFTQAFGLEKRESDLDFFDVNLQYDSRIFIDPFLIRKSAIETERVLFDRFGDFFRYAYDLSLTISTDVDDYNKLKDLLNIHEPEEIGLGYTESSHRGTGPGPSFAGQLFNFFVNSSAKRLIKEEGLYADGKFNPATLEVFVDRIGPDAISDITANLIMDYLIKYTQNQCEVLGIALKSLPVRYDGFDFKEMEWMGGGYYDLPENPMDPGHPVVLIPKRFLRAPELNSDNMESKVKGILLQDPQLVHRFGSLIHKRVSEIGIDDIRSVFLSDESVFKSYLEALSKNRSVPYDFEADFLKLLSVKSYSKFFSQLPRPTTVATGDDLVVRTFEFLEIVKDHFSRADGWRDTWRERGHTPIPCKEEVFGRIFRGMGYAYFANLPEVTFESEVDMGNGPVDFKIIYKDCRIVIELKRLVNSSYLQGIEEQLPDYAHLSHASHAIYITGQHYTQTNRPQTNHNARVTQIQSLVRSVEEKIKADTPEFQKLYYVNISFAPHPSSSKKELAPKGEKGKKPEREEANVESLVVSGSE